MVHAFSTHNLLLRYWLASGGADPDRDIETVVIPPEDVVEALAAGTIAGFCAGAPWGDVAERQQAGRILIGTSVDLAVPSGEVPVRRAKPGPTPIPNCCTICCARVLRAQIRCDQPEEAPAIAALLADPDGLRLPEEACRAALPGGSGAELIRFHTREAWFPARAHALWFLGQMRRWGWLDRATDLDDRWQPQVYRPDLLASAVRPKDFIPPRSLPALEGTAMLPMPDDEAFSLGSDTSPIEFQTDDAHPQAICTNNAANI